MTPMILLKGLLIGISVAAPVGPIGILTIKRTLSEGRLSGFITGIGAALADTVYGIIAGFGLTAISSFLVTQEFWLKFPGGLFLLYLGFKAYRSNPETNAMNLKSLGLFKNLISSFFLTLMNPSTIFSFLAIFAVIGLGSAGSDYISSSILVLGVFTGSALWWLGLCSVTGLFKSKITNGRLVWINKLSGLILISFGIWALYSSGIE